MLGTMKTVWEIYGDDYDFRIYQTAVIWRLDGQNFVPLDVNLTCFDEIRQMTHGSI